ARARVMGTFALFGSIATCAGTVAGQSPWVAVPALFVSALLCSLVRVRGDTAAVSGVLVLTMFCITEGTPARAGQGLVRAELFANRARRAAAGVGRRGGGGAQPRAVRGRAGGDRAGARAGFTRAPQGGRYR